MAPKKLNQVLAVEKTVKARREGQVTEIYHKLQKPDLTRGLTKKYQPKTDGGEGAPPEKLVVQLNVEESMKTVGEAWKEIFNLGALKDATNCAAKADVSVDGEVILKNVPATHLLFLEKKLGEFQKIVSILPTLPTETEWSFDAGENLHRSSPVETMRTKKVEKWETIVPPTKEHPAQTQKITTDEIVGTYTTITFSGAIPANRKKTLLDRTEKYIRAVKEAREEANQTPVVELATGLILERILAP